MHYLSYHQPQSQNWDERKPELANKGVQWKDKESAFSANFATFYCSTSKCAAKCQVLGKSVDWFITTCKWDGRQLLHYGYAILEETHSFQRAIATGKDIFLQKYHVHKAINDLTSCLVYQQSANLLKCDVLGVQTFTLKYVWLMCVCVIVAV